MEQVGEGSTVMVCGDTNRWWRYHFMELVAQLVERRIVVPDAVGSIPTFLPTLHIYCSGGAFPNHRARRGQRGVVCDQPTLRTLIDFSKNL